MDKITELLKKAANLNDSNPDQAAEYLQQAQALQAQFEKEHEEDADAAAKIEAARKKEVNKDKQVTLNTKSKLRQFAKSPVGKAWRQYLIKGQYDRTILGTEDDKLGQMLPTTLVNPADRLENEASLSLYSDKRAVETKTGTIPTILYNGEPLVEVPENTEVPLAQLPVGSYKNWNIKTFAHSFKYSWQWLEDATNFDWAADFQKFLFAQLQNTENTQIMTLMKKFSPEKNKDGVALLDQIKTAVTKLDPRAFSRQNLRIYASTSGWNTIDLIKDKNDHYLVTYNDPKSESGKSINGVPVIVLPDNIFGGAAGDTPIAFWIGDLYSAIAELTKGQLFLKTFTQANLQNIMTLAFRADWLIKDERAGFYIGFDADPSNGAEIPSFENPNPTAKTPAAPAASGNSGNGSSPKASK